MGFRDMVFSHQHKHLVESDTRLFPFSAPPSAVQEKGWSNEREGVCPEAILTRQEVDSVPSHSAALRAPVTSRWPGKATRTRNTSLAKRCSEPRLNWIADTDSWRRGGLRY